MGKRERKLKQWKNNPPKDVPVSEVKAVVNFYFPSSQKKGRRGSHHIVVKDERLKGFREFGPLGQLMIPVKGGQKVKGCYLQDLALAVEIINEDPEGD